MSGADDLRPKWNYRRRAVGIACWFSPALLLVVSLAVGLFSSKESGVGIGRVIALAVGCLLVPAINFYLSWIRPTLYARHHGSMEGYRFISGIPLIGTLLVVLFSGFLAFGDWPAAAVGLVALVLDTGGLPWLLISTWRDESFWDA